jgi:hypothetical protein
VAQGEFDAGEFGLISFIQYQELAPLITQGRGDSGSVGSGGQLSFELRERSTRLVDAFPEPLRCAWLRRSMRGQLGG